MVGNNIEVYFISSMAYKAAIWFSLRKYARYVNLSIKKLIKVK